uniref:Maestro heat-like repeat-containing protein family member 2A n=1 Tax=Pogona vitticeps TaxID=103695 RepID=A0ABM5ERZ5_9SAUR
MGNRGKRDQVQLGIQHDFYFLRCMINSCMEAQLKKEAQLDVPFSKAEMVSALVEVVERHQSPCKSGSILPSALTALSHLSRLKPKTPRELETRFLGLALPVLASLQELSQDREEQTFYENTTQSMQVLLQSLLQEDPTIGHLFSLLDVSTKERRWGPKKPPGDGRPAQGVRSPLSACFFLSSEPVPVPPQPS